MRRMTVKELVKAIDGMLITGSDNSIIYRLATDSREAGPGEVFFALKGINNDAHDYIGQVLERGCRTLVVSDPDRVPQNQFLNLQGEPDIVVVEDTLKALQAFGKYHMELLGDIKKIAITGSVGKTSTRDMTYAVLSTRYKTGKNFKNFNNSFGLPQTLMSFEEGTEACVCEMGMDLPHSIGVLAELVRPNVAIVTNVLNSHIEHFPGGRMGILETKLEVAGYFDDDGKLIVNADNDLLGALTVESLREYGIRGRLIRVGSNEEMDYTVSDVRDYGDDGIEFKLAHDGKEYPVRLGLPGAHNAVNAALSLAAGELMGVSLDEGIEGLKNTEFTGNRLNIRIAPTGQKVINDSYNAAPESVKSAINTLMATKAQGKRVAIIGDMGELGPESVRGHREVGIHAAKSLVDTTLFVGPKSRDGFDAWVEYNTGLGHDVSMVLEMPPIFADRTTGCAAEFFEQKEHVIEGITSHTGAGDVILIKASRYMQFEKIAQRILGE